MSPSLTDQLSKIQPGGHLCLFYENDPAEQMPALITFIRDGLLQDEQFVYIADDQTADELAAHLENSGIDVVAETESGRLKLYGRKEWRQPGELESSKKAGQVRQFVAEAAQSGFKGIRFAVEMTWTLGPDIEARKLEHWEATINTLFEPTFPARIICQYNKSRLNPEALIAALRTHPEAIVRNAVYPNHFFEAPLILNGSGHKHLAGGLAAANGNGNGKGARERLEWMISQLHRANEAERGRIDTEVLRRTNQRLAHFAESASIPLHWVDSEGIIRWANQAELELLGYSKEEYIGRNIAGIHADPKVIADILQRLANRERIKDYPARLRTKSGEIKHVLIDSSVLWENDHFIHTQCFTRDVTSQKLAEIEASKNRQALAEQVSGLIQLNNLSHRLATTDDFEAMMRVILEDVIKLHGTDRGLLLLFDESKRMFSTGASVNFTRPELGQSSGVPPWAEPGGFAFTERGRIVIEDTETDPLFAPYRQYARMVGFRALHRTPLLSRDGRILGSFSVYFSCPCRPTAHQILFTDMHARQAADFIERHKVEKALRDSQEYLRSIIDNSPECIKLVAQDGTLLDMNAAGCRMVGAQRPSDVIGRNVYDLIAPEDRERFKAMNERVCSGHTENLTFQIVSLTGSRLHMETHATPLRDPVTGRLNQLGATRNITGQKAMYEASRFLAAVVESSDDAIITKDLNGIITSWNKSAERLFGYKAEEVIGKPVGILIPQDRVDEEPNILARLRQGQRIDHYETIRRRKDGSLFDISLTVSPVRDAEGKIIGASKTARDITERKAREQEIRHMKEQLLRANETLEQRVEERTASLREAIAQIEEFSYTVSHDLRAPVRAMKAYSEATLEDYGDRLDEKGRGFLNHIIRGSSRMERLIHDVLTYSRLARADIQLQPVSIQNLIADIIQQYPGMQPPHVVIKLGKPLLAVLAHEALLSQAISNILSNAVKFVAPGTTPHVEIWTEARNGKVRLWIKDNGIGIQPDYQTRIFDMFERVHQDKNYEGTGIGLAIVRKAVEKMGGTLGVESDGFNGSRFWIELSPADR